MSEEWKELKEIISLNNIGAHHSAINLAATFDLNDKPRLLAAVLSAYILTPEFVCKHINETYKIINAIHNVKFSGVRDSFRASYLVALFDDVTHKKGDL